MTPDARIVAWTGRLVDAWPGGLDDWSVTRQTIRDDVDHADLLLLIDPPSFNYALLGLNPGLPFVAVLPTGLPAETVADLLGVPLVKWATAFDRIVVDGSDVKDALADRYDVPEETWVVGMKPDWQSVVRDTIAGLGPLQELAERKAAWFGRCKAVADELRFGLHGTLSTEVAPWASTPLVALDGDTRHWDSQVTRLATVDVTSLDRVLADPGQAGFPVPSPDAVALVLPDGGQTPDERVARVRAAFDVLPPGGQLVIDAHVVDTDDDRVNPGIGQLLEEVHEATGAAVHLENITSARRRGERYTRGVLLRYTSLKVGEVSA